MLLLWYADFFSNLTFSKISFRNSIRVSNSLDPDQGQHSVGPDLGPNYLQRFSVGMKFATNRQRLKYYNQMHLKRIFICNKIIVILSVFIFCIDQLLKHTK